MNPTKYNIYPIIRHNLQEFIRDKIDCEALNQMKSTYNPEIYEQYIQNTKIMDKIRGFSIGSLL